ncbi:serine protease [Okeania sp. KiyG1]|uniref:S1 family peptidase n=1 Tax=Okeania sp. KiyG1 TaxID=2720165 RepID=UPI00192351DD|nr:serine protease [Okeania sp. KiyG1]GGA27099.1 hypothetical protein CYANOKiyG1_43300 [Okeania sp. KiyG1]
MTASHVIKNRDIDKLKVATFNGKQYPIEEIEKESNLDLAILKFTSEQKYSSAKLNCADVQEGADVYVSGYPNNLEWARNFQMTNGIISSTKDIVDNNRVLTYTNNTTSGMSGGPVLDRKGCLIGVHSLSDLQLNRQSEAILLPNNRLEPIPVKTGFKIGIPIKPNRGNIQAMISQANQIPTPPKSKPTSTIQSSPSPTPKSTPTIQSSPSPTPIPKIPEPEVTATEPTPTTVQSSSFKPEEKEAISIINSMFQVQKQRLEEDNFECIDYKDCRTKVFLNSINQMKRNGVDTNSENYNFVIRTTTRGVFHYATPKRGINNLNLKAFVGAILLPETASSNNPETNSITCSTNNSVEKSSQIPDPNYSLRNRPNCRQGTFNIEASEFSENTPQESPKVEEQAPEFSENTPQESPKVEEQAPVQLSSIFIADVCESYSKEPSQKKDEALNFLQKKISENQRSIWINFAQQWRKDSGLVMREPKDLFLTNVCLNYQPEEYKNHKKALETFQSAINKLPSEVQSQFLEIWNAYDELK